jgi:hypothetical protein
MAMLSPHWEKRKARMEKDLGISTSKTPVRGSKTSRGL